MAMYIPPGRRRRRILLAVGAALVVGIALGVVAGRATAPTIEDRVRDARDAAAAAIAQIQALPIEYEQELSGAETFADGGASDAIARARAELDDAIADAPWITPEQIDTVHEALDDLEDAARAKVAAGDFETRVADATETLATVFGTT